MSLISILFIFFKTILTAKLKIVSTKIKAMATVVLEMLIFIKANCGSEYKNNSKNFEETIILIKYPKTIDIIEMSNVSV